MPSAARSTRSRSPREGIEQLIGPRTILPIGERHSVRFPQIEFKRLHLFARETGVVDIQIDFVVDTERSAVGPARVE